MYQVEATINMPNGEEYLIFTNATFDMIASVIETEFPTMTSFVLVATKIKED